MSPAGGPPPPGPMEQLLDRLDLDCHGVAPAEVPAFRRELPVRHARMLVTEGADQFSLRCVPADRVDLPVYFREAHPSRLLGRPEGGWRFGRCTAPSGAASSGSRSRCHQALRPL